ncbi:MAG: hypothetical protein AAFY22_03160 [Pseudomonadota bacterium]
MNVDLENEGGGGLGMLAANRPLLTSVVVAFGLTALSVIGYLRSPSQGVAEGLPHVTNFALNGLVALALPAVIAVFAPEKRSQRIVVAAAGAILLFAGGQILTLYQDAAPALRAAALYTASALTLLMIAPRRFFGDASSLAVAGPVTAVLGAFGAGGLISMADAVSMEVVGAIASLSLALACLVGVSLSADFVRLFASGVDAHNAAGQAAHQALAPAANAALVTVAVFSAGILPGPQQLSWTWTAIFYSAGGIVVAVAATLLVTAASLSLRPVPETIAVGENRRQSFARALWRPIRQLLPPSSALAFVAILAIVLIVALFEAYGATTLIKLALIGLCAVAAGLTFVSVRTGFFVMAALFAAMVLIDAAIGVFGAARPQALAEMAAIAAGAALFGQIALSWRDARDPRRKPHEAAEQAMIDGAYRYILGAILGVSAFAMAAVSGLWDGGADAAWYLSCLSLVGFILAAPLMTAISALSSSH